MYKLLKDLDGNIGSVFNDKLGTIPFDPDNTDAQQFKIWLQEGNIPTSADGETIVTQEEVDAIITLLNG
jgi:hypothetical protein